MAGESCPLTNIGHPNADIPETCESSCSEIWEKARKARITSGPYNFYTDDGLEYDESEDSDCKHPRCDVENSEISLTSWGQFIREYVVIDQYDCGIQLGEQGFSFTCPLPLENNKM